MNMLTKAKNLRLLDADNLHKKIVIKPDLTKLQQKEQMTLQEECKRRRASGEDVVINRGKVVLRQL